MNIPFHKPTLDFKVNDLFEKSFKTGWLTTGPQVKSFELLLSKFTNYEFAIAVNSCTAALHLSLAAKGIGENDKYIVPTYTFVATVEVGEYLGAKPVFVDSCMGTMNLDLDKVQELLEKDKEKKIKAIIPVHFAGLSIDNYKLKEISEKYNVFILEDSAHALETISKREKIAYNHSVALSFYANKNMTTGGEGGALLTNDKELASIIRKLSLHGMSRDGWKRYEVGGKWEYDIEFLGYKYNMTDLSASFGISQINHIFKWHNKRYEIFNLYNLGLQSIEGIVVPEIKGEEFHSFHLYIIRIVSNFWKITRNEIINELNKVGISTSVHYIPVHMHSYYKNKYALKYNDFPNAYELSQTVISLPIYPLLSNREVNYIVESLSLLWKKYRK